MENIKKHDDIYEMVNKHGGVNVAIKNAKRRMSDFEKRRYKPSEYDPRTMVYRLVEELIKFIT